MPQDVVNANGISETIPESTPVLRAMEKGRRLFFCRFVGKLRITNNFQHKNRTRSVASFLSGSGLMNRTFGERAVRAIRAVPKQTALGESSKGKLENYNEQLNEKALG